jgi:NADH:ubiquinone oxidoreductase subunit 2 (subunit N)
MSLTRAGFYPLPNLFLVEDYYLCDIFSGYVKGIFYFLLSFYVLMIYDRLEYLYRDSTNTKIGLIALLFLTVFTTAAISSFDLFFFYLAIEGMSFSTLLVFTFSGVKKVSRQAALRYFCLNAFASG